MLEGPFPGLTIGWDKYGRIQLGARATYAWTSAFSVYGGWNGNWTPQPIQRNAVLGGPNNGLIPLFRGQAANAMWTSPALDAYTNPTQGAHEARNVYILTSRVRFSF